MSRWKAASSAVRPIKIGQMTDGLYAVVMDVPAFHVCSTDLGVANGGLDGWGPFHGHMPQIIGDLFQRPASLAGTMRKIMAQIMKRESSDEFPFLVVGLPLEAPEPLVNAIFGETRTPLGGKDVGTRSLTPAMLEVVIQGATCLVQQIDVTELLALVSDMEPADLRTHMRVFHQEVCRIAHTASGPVSQGEDG